MALFGNSNCDCGANKDTCDLSCLNELDKYGNPIDGSRLINCCFPDCGCACARVCMAENGASYASIALNVEHRKGK